MVTIVSGKVLESVYYNYRESAWERLMNFISKEIEKGNEEEVKNGVKHVRENYSNHYKNGGSYMGVEYQKEIKNKIDLKLKNTENDDLTKRSTE